MTFQSVRIRAGDYCHKKPGEFLAAPVNVWEDENSGSAIANPRAAFMDRRQMMMYGLTNRLVLPGPPSDNSHGPIGCARQRFSSADSRTSLTASDIISEVDAIPATCR